MTPIYSTLKGKLNIPVPIALARRVKITPLKDPSDIGPKVRRSQDRLTGASSAYCVMSD